MSQRSVTPRIPWFSITMARVLILLSLIYPVITLLAIAGFSDFTVLLIPIHLLEIASSVGLAAFLITVALYVGLLILIYFAWKTSDQWLAMFLFAGATGLMLLLMAIRSL
jgi:hypothetical protein